MTYASRTILVAWTVTALSCFSFSQIHAQLGPPFEWPTKGKNLKVLPPDFPPEKLRAVMTGFTRALGVRCSHCHVGVEGQPLSTFDFPSDANPKKDIARDMYRMLGSINDQLKGMKLEGPKRVNMWCHTCHRGRPLPSTLAETLAATYDSSGVDSTVAAYHALRTRYYGRGSLDFGEGSLIEVSESIAAKGKLADAIRIHRLNVEGFPEAVRPRAALAETYAADGQKDRAIETYKEILKLDPKNPNAHRRIEELTKTGK